MILVDRGMMDDHLPNNVLAALKRCQWQVRRKTTASGSRPKEERGTAMEVLVDRGQSAKVEEVRDRSAEVGGQSAKDKEREDSAGEGKQVVAAEVHEVRIIHEQLQNQPPD